MAVPFLNNVDLTNNQILNVRLQNLASAPSSGIGAGQVYYNTANNRPAWYNGTSWSDIYPSATANTANTEVLRDGSGNFSAGTITAALTGNASTATTLQTARNIGISGSKVTATAASFNGSADININVTALSVVPGDIALANGSFIVGNASTVGAATAKNAIPLSGFAAAAADVAMGGFKITGLGTPTATTDAATKAYVDSTAQGLDVKLSVRLATAAALPTVTYASGVLTASANAALTVDGVAVAAGDRILVKDQATQTQNGIYTVTNAGSGVAAFVLTRATDFNTSALAAPGSFTFVEEGTANSDTGWVMTANAPITLDTTNITWSQFSGAGSYTASRGLVLSGTAFNFAQSTAYTTGDLPYASGASTIAMLAGVATGNVLLSGGVATAPSWGKVNLTTHITGILGIANGGTNSSAITNGGVAFGSGGAYTFTAALTAGQIVVANASAVPTATTVTGDVTINSSGVTAIGSNKVTVGMLAQLAGLSILGNSTNASANVAAITGTADQVLRVNSAGTILGFGQINLASSNAVTGTLPIANGGTGLASIGAQYTVAVSTGTGVSWTTVDLSNSTSGVLPGSKGGTGTQYAQFTTGGSTLRTYSLTDRNAQLAAQVSGNFTGNNTATQFSATHNLNSKNVVVSLYDSGDNQVYTDTKTLDANTVQFTFAVAPSNVTTYRWVVVGY